MSVTAADSASGAQSTGSVGRLLNRQIDSYPDTGPRILYLAITVLATVTLYYELYVAGSVATLQLQALHMSFVFYVTILALGNLLGAFGSLFAGITDRLGRSNLVVAGLLLTGVLTAFIIPEATNKWAFGVEFWLLGIVEGICLVATPALIRDFSPQVGRATAMGFWTSGPVLGSLIVAVVGTNTINAHTTWPHEYRICGVAGLVVFVLAALLLRELSPGLRDQLMVSMNDRALIEARAKGIDVEDSLRHPWGQLLKADVIISALGVSLMLLVYYTAVAFGTIYLSTVFGFSLKDANGLGNWNWGFNVIAVILVGVVSDRLRVRKPFMVVGGVAATVMLILYLTQAGHHTSYYHLAILLAALSFALGVAYTPWMASFTETVESRNPALTATGLAIWGWIVRIVVFVSYMLLPVIVHSVTPLVTYGTQVQAYVAQYPKEIAIAQANPALFAKLATYPPGNSAAIPLSLKLQLVKAAGSVTEAQKFADPKVSKALTYLQAHAGAVQNAAKDSPGQWKTWYWICVGGIVFFLGCIPLLRGRWSPKAARVDEEAHEAMVAQEMQHLHVP